jgi:hypothetical protein
MSLPQEKQQHSAVQQLVKVREQVAVLQGAEEQQAVMVIDEEEEEQQIRMPGVCIHSPPNFFFMYKIYKVNLSCSLPAATSLGNVQDLLRIGRYEMSSINLIIIDKEEKFISKIRVGI